MAFLSETLSSFSLLEILLIVINGLLLLFSKPIFSLLSHGQLSAGGKSRLNVFRAINALIILLILFYHLFLPISGDSWVTKIVGVLFVVYLSHLGFYIASFFILARFGRVREVEDETHLVETYNTRALRLLAAILFFVIALIGSVQVLEFESLLQAGGVIGFVGVLLALTQGSWAPDIISGLIILNSNLLEEGDVLQLEDGHAPLVAVVFKTKMFHTELLNVVNNHRMMIRNARLRDYTIHNLSKFASARGLREMLSFNIGYEAGPAQAREMFKAAFQLAVDDGAISIESQHPLEIMTAEAGDYAVRWNVYYYTKDIRNLIRTRQQLTGCILKSARTHNISLATPQRHVLEQGPHTTHLQQVEDKDRASTV